jgi:hypothetical protein
LHFFSLCSALHPPAHPTEEGRTRRKRFWQHPSPPRGRILAINPIINQSPRGISILAPEQTFFPVLNLQFSCVAQILHLHLFCHGIYMNQQNQQL